MLYDDFFNSVFREYLAVYDTNANYNTNAKSYYDDLAKKNHMIMILSKKIWEYDEELAKRFAEWDKNLEEFPNEIEILLREWMDDGTFSHIINEEIFHYKSTIITSRLEPKNPDNQTYWFEVVDEAQVPKDEENLSYDYLKGSE